MRDATSANRGGGGECASDEMPNVSTLWEQRRLAARHRVGANVREMRRPSLVRVRRNRAVLPLVLRQKKSNLSSEQGTH